MAQQTATVHTMSAEALAENVAFTTALGNLQSKIDEICLFGDKTVSDGNYMEIMADLKTLFEESKQLTKTVYNTTIVQQAVQRSAARPRKTFANKEAKLKHKDYTTCNLCDEVITRGYRVPHQKTMKCRRIFITKKLSLKPIGHKIAHQWANLRNDEMCVKVSEGITEAEREAGAFCGDQVFTRREIITRDNQRQWSNMNTFIFVDRNIRAKLDRHFEATSNVDIITTPSGKMLDKLCDIKKPLDLEYTALYPNAEYENFIQYGDSDNTKIKKGKFGAPKYYRPEIPPQKKGHIIPHNDYTFVDELLAIEPAPPTPKPKKLKKKIVKKKKMIIITEPKPEPEPKPLSNDIITDEDDAEAERSDTPTLEFENEEEFENAVFTDMRPYGKYTKEAKKCIKSMDSIKTWAEYDALRDGAFAHILKKMNEDPNIDGDMKDLFGSKLVELQGRLFRENAEDN